MIDYEGMAKEVVKALEENNKLFKEFIFNYPEVTILNKDICKRIAENTNTNEDCEFYYRFFNTEYSIDFLGNFATNTKYIIDQVDIDDYSVFLTQDIEDVDWLPVIFIKEFWDFYFDYISKKRENEKMVCSLKLREGLKQNEEQNEANIDDICKTIAEDFVKNYNNYIRMFTTFNNFSNPSENDCAEFFTNFLKRLF